MAFRRKPGGLPYPIRQLAQEAQSSPNTGPTPTSQYIFGTHAAHMYEQNTVRTIWSPHPKGIPVPVGPLIQIPPQSVDLTLQGFITGVRQLAQGKVPSLIVITQQSYQDSPSFVVTSRVTPPVAQKLISQFVAAPQNDPTQIAASIYPSTTAEGTVGAPTYIFGTHAANIYEQNASRSLFHSAPASAAAISGRLLATIVVGQQSYTDSPSFIIKSQPAKPQFSTHFIIASPQSDPTQLQGLVFLPGRNEEGFVGAAQYQFGTHQAAIYEANTTRVVWTVHQQPAAPTSGNVPKLITCYPQIDFTQQALIWQAQLASGFLTWEVLGESQDDPTVVQGLIFQPLVRNVQAEQPIKSLLAEPQFVDFTQQGLIFVPLPQAPAIIVPLRPILAGPQLLDLTQQGWISGTSQHPQGQVPPLRIGQPQALDLTQQGWILKSQPAPQAPIIHGPTIWMMPPVLPQPDLSVNQSWTHALYKVGPTAVINSSAGPIKGYFYADSIKGKFFSEIIKGYFS